MKSARKDRDRGDDKRPRRPGRRPFAEVYGQILGLVSTRASSFASGGLDLLAPPACLVCGHRLPLPRLFCRPKNRRFSLCVDCSRRLVLVGPACFRCGRQLSAASGAAGSDRAGRAWMDICGNCQQVIHPHDSVSCVVAYEGIGRELVLAYKKSRGRAYLSCMVELLSLRSSCGPVAPGSAGGPVVVCGIPRHPVDCLLRGGSKGDLLAAAFAARQGLVFRQLLRKRRWTVRQAGLGRKPRLRNLRGAFAMRGSRKPPSRVLLVDDVLTTGATVRECASILKSAGTGRVDVLTVARSLDC